MKKEKITSFSHFMYYYKWHVILSVVAVLIIVFSVRSCANKIETDLVVTAIVSNNTAVDTGESIEADLVKAGLIPDFDGNGICAPRLNIVTMPLNPQTEMDMAGSYQGMIAMATDDSILFLVDEDLLEIYEDQQPFRDISDTAAKYGITEENLYIDVNGMPIGISVADNEYLKEKGFVTDTLYACFREGPVSGEKDNADIKIKAAEDIFDFMMK